MVYKIYNVNRSGRSTGPYGIPQVQAVGSENVSLYTYYEVDHARGVGHR